MVGVFIPKVMTRLSDCGISIFSTPLPLSKYEPKPPPELPLEIWLEIFEFATHIHGSTTILPLDPFAVKRNPREVISTNTPSLSMRTKLALVQVCHEWRRIAVRVLYKHVVIRSPARASLILNVLRQSAVSIEPGGRAVGYGQWTRHIEMYTFARGTHNIRYLQTLFWIFQCCPNLQVLTGAWIHPLPIEFVNSIAKCYSPVLRELSWYEAQNMGENHSTVVPPSFLASFHFLTVLDLRNFIGSDPADYRTESSMSRSLPRLKHLILSTHPRSLTAATALDLPSLENLTLRAGVFQGPISYNILNQLLRVHGTRLLSVDLPSPSADAEPEPDRSALRRNAEHVKPDVFLDPDVCPNLTCLVFPTTSPPIKHVGHRGLRRVGLRGVRAEGLYPDKSSSTKTHLTSITADRYPHLEIIKTIGFMVDASSDTLIKDVFIWWTERFEKQGIDFLDGEGVLWAYTESCAEEAGEETDKDKDAPSSKTEPPQGDVKAGAPTSYSVHCQPLLTPTHR
ncbi:hypothetical protein AX16_006895 [Volvariella volvacea WC 439]|nr:hypothetical protein AX16_006895 [Volvariella volvacea WC 439]